ncbi:chryseobasin-related MNIO class RiPP peptide [Chitinophaga japonensis]|uniref:Uncharacterized protein n=1 Tax=Chitinophaga japonensis TaxID=104662 RepID=A0A562SY14_CHIJA|nr:hypothetical protein [Chitinophaga japonensis]TWI86211.1 hypothetical protein LX66_3463 [Chitinophaga japonensis]
MKLSKSLLSAILIGIAVQTTATSCEKDNTPEPQVKHESKDGTDKTPQVPDGCPACGMG